MDQTPAHDNHNPDLLKLIPIESRNLIELGCSSGALAREFKKINPRCKYVGADIDPAYVELAKRYCDQAIVADIDTANQSFFTEHADKDCWVLGDVLEHLRDPWSTLRNIRNCIPGDGSVVTCIPNAQHWSVQVRLCVGDFNYEDNGLFDRTHLRWFTRQTIIGMFDAAGFQIVEGISRVFPEPAREKFLPKIASLAEAAGFDPKVAVNDSMPLQYVLRAVPR